MAAQSTYSLVFDGTGYAPTTLALSTGTGDLSISAWIKTSTNGIQEIIDNYDVDGGQYFVFRVGDGSTNNVLNMVCGNDTDRQSCSGVTALDDNAWHHVLGSRVGSLIKLYVDGVLDNSSTSTTRSITTAKVVVIGALSVGGGTYVQKFSGNLDDIALFQSDQSGNAAAIAGTPGVAGSSSLDVATLSPTGLWRAEAGTGTTLADTSGGGHDGTLTGGATWSALDAVPLPLQAGAAAGSVGTAAGTSTAAGVGASLAAAVGSAAGIGTAAAVGKSLAAAAAASSGTGTAAAVGASLAAAVGSSSGIGTAAAVGASLAAATSTVSGTGTASAVGASLAAAAGAADGVATVAGFSPGASTGTAAGTCTVAGVGASLAAAVGTATGTCTVVGIAPGGIVTVAGPYYFTAAALYVAGASAGLVYAAGASAGQITTE